MEKNNLKKLTKAEESVINNIEAEAAVLQERLQTLDTIVEHLNETKFEDFGRRFKKETFENNESKVVKISKDLTQLEEQTNLQNKANDLLQKNFRLCRRSLLAKH